MYGMVEPLLVTQPYVGKNVVVEHVLWTVTVTTATSGSLAEVPRGDQEVLLPRGWTDPKRVEHSTARVRTFRISATLVDDWEQASDQERFNTRP